MADSVDTIVASAVQLTAKGASYCETHSRQEIETEIERLIDLLDAIDPDPDEEVGGDLEPMNGWPTHIMGRVTLEMTQDDEREAVNEDGGDILDERHDQIDEDTGVADADALHDPAVRPGCERFEGTGYQLGNDMLRAHQLPTVRGVVGRWY